MEDLRAIRHYLHQHPELSEAEHQTQAYLRGLLEKLNPKELVEIAETGLLASFGAPVGSPRILLRADLDALPIDESNQFLHRSKHKGVAHKCGHDGHSAVMMGVADYFSKHPPAEGNVSILFQPAEEIGTGAQRCLSDPLMRDRHYDFTFAFHNLPGVKAGSVCCKPGAFTASALSCAYHFSGKTAHAAQPERGKNPAGLLAKSIKLAQSLSQPDHRREDFQLITPIYAHLGHRSYGVSAGAGEAHFTLRTHHDESLKRLYHQLTDHLGQAAAEEGIAMTSDYFEAFHNVINDAQAVQLLKESCQELGQPYLDMEEAFRWTEDFGLFTQRFSGAMFVIGAGEDQPALHNPDYDFNDDLLAPARDLFVALSLKALTGPKAAREASAETI